MGPAKSMKARRSGRVNNRWRDIQSAGLDAVQNAAPAQPRLEFDIQTGPVGDEFQVVRRAETMQPVHMKRLSQNKPECREADAGAPDRLAHE